MHSDMPSDRLYEQKPCSIGCTVTVNLFMLIFSLSHLRCNKNVKFVTIIKQFQVSNCRYFVKATQLTHFELVRYGPTSPDQ